jgi:hypothetical protein
MEESFQSLFLWGVQEANSKGRTVSIQEEGRDGETWVVILNGLRPAGKGNWNLPWKWETKMDI